MSSSNLLGRIRWASSVVQLRMRLARILGVLPLLVPLTILLTATTLAAHKAYPTEVPQSLAWILFGCIAGATVATCLVLGLWPLPPNAGAVALDRQHKLDGRLANALEFAEIPTERRTVLMQAAIDEACAFVADRPKKTTLRAAVAAPLLGAAIVSWWLFPLLLVPSAGMLVLVSAFEIRTPKPPPEKVVLTKKKSKNAVDLNKDDLKAIKQDVADLTQKDQSSEMKAAVDRFNKLIEDLAAKRLDRDEAFRQMEGLEKDLLNNAENERKALAEELKETAKELEKSDLAKDLADALKKDDLKKAEEEMRKLSEKLVDKKKPVDKAQLQKLRDALKKAIDKRRKELENATDKVNKAKEDLLKKKKQIADEKDPEKKKEEERLLKKKQEELETLEREEREQKRLNDQLDQLDRELAEAAAALAKELGLTPEELQKAAEQLEKAAKDLNRLERESMTEQEKENLKQKLEELREMIRKEGKRSAGQKKVRKSFNDKANGKSSKGKKSKKKGDSLDREQGDEGDEEGDEDGEGDEEGDQGDEGDGGDQGDQGDEGDGEGDGQKGQKGKKGKGKKGQGGQGQGDGPGDGVEISLGPGGVPIPVPGSGDGNMPGGQGSGEGGKEWGTGSGGPIAGAATDPNMGTQNVHQNGAEASSGPTNSQVINSAARKGFRGAEYKRVFGQYKTVAEENIDQEEIPSGYRLYVKHYFHLIRPRE